MTCGPTIWMPQVFLAGDLMWELMPTSFADHNSRDGKKSVVIRSFDGPILILIKSFPQTNHSAFRLFPAFPYTLPNKDPTHHTKSFNTPCSLTCLTWWPSSLLNATLSFAPAPTVKVSILARQAAITSSSSLFSKASSFESSWQSLSQSFAQTQSTQFQQSVSQMYSSYQSIMTTSQQFYASQYQAQLLRMFYHYLSNAMDPLTNPILSTAIL
ncbi:hypothetical protein MJO28_003952 [Puccinia striiformis f. sp. tritici]|uniref:Uncharacterized protein n=1 Tax=Puccinia striiformis f. sp. tritici TaxID=168172 RepID=A0ACC0EPQ7_9BASI|nr:hypothetical protein MJO28_003952 [Puccinia striiformis f. sp. tritici]KAI7963950.1 hypothetical protein MJO29_004377 [Puccinia striiformis f. sp. tritici]